VSPQRVVVTGGAGFVGSHLCEQLLASGDEVVCVDNFVTGHIDNVAGFVGRPGFCLLETDISEGLPVEGAVDAILNFASPASPPDYLALPIETLMVGQLQAGVTAPASYRRRPVRSTATRRSIPRPSPTGAT
jgi:nucleoside-diphosphate-sugar epimerase